MWWIFESSVAGELRRTDDVISRIPSAPYTGGFHSASTIRQHPARLFAADMPDVTLGPRVSVSRACAPSYMPFAVKVSTTALRTCSRDGTPSNRSA